ncbi:Gfo/Idh/MocA family protein [Rhodohalobacter sulfatireducens]|uniref:Gfo/Idh/MocA family oxidoreductase n=1 Tax=Rhodohalobacter sulfatireducens TaxID=2911366 RepID=A0ABS9KGK4_9BACT|nr:Gfo/Idh/MocA family oxidoreductase [Rhodohalobacter sulfatireducens]MCG2589984.1 Gfo/Idh/MocA family oxidoreductase [Rhodohalobacter sulfatireducens]
MSNLNVGIVGLGWVAGAHIETFKNVTGANVTAVYSRRNLDENQLQKQYGIPLKAYDDFDDMLADPSLDIIDICTEHPLHAEQAIAAAKAGKHLIIEKPIALNYKDAKSVGDAIQEAGVQACVCFEVRFSGQGLAIRSMIDEGLLGDIHYGEVDYYHGIGPWYNQYKWNIKKEEGGSSLLTAGCHALDLLLWYMDAEVEEVTSYSNQSKSPHFTPYEYDTTSVTLLKFKNGRLGKVASVIDALQPYYFHIHLTGSEGSVLDDQFYSSKLKGTTKDRWSRIAAPLIDSGDVDDHPYQPQFQEFIESINRNEPMKLTDFKTAFYSHKVAYAADLSAKTGRPVKLSDLDS